MDILEALTASAAIVAAWRAVHGSSRAWVWIGVWTGLAFATKENAFVTAALVGGVLGLILAYRGLHRTIPATLRWTVDHRWNLLAAVAAAVLVTVPIFTVGFRHPEDWFFPYKAISYWWGQHSIERVAGPPWYHLPRLALYEFLPIAAALSWAIRRGRKMRTLEWSLLLFGVASVGMYCYLGEKVPWLGVHQVWAFVPLAGMQLARTFGPRGVWWSRTLAVLGLVATAVTTLVANYILDEISPRRERVEALIYVQTCPEILPLVAEGQRLAAEGVDPVAAVGGEASWPLSWYWRSTPVWWSEPAAGQRPPLVFTSPEKQAPVRSRLGGGYTSERLPLRAWWVMEDSKPSLVDILRYVVTRRPWGVIGSTDFIVMHRIDDHGDDEPSEEIARGALVPEPLAATFDFEGGRVIGEGWVVEPRGLAVSRDGILAVADTGLESVAFFDPDGGVRKVSAPEGLNQPEAVAWTPDGVLVVADTWNHRVLLHNPGSGVARPLPEPDGGWYGPRAVAVAADGTIAVADTGHKRIVIFTPGDQGLRVDVIGSEGSEPGQLVEPVGLTWLDDRRLLVCDTGNRRLQVLDRRGRALEVVALPGGWSDFYSRPQVVALAPDRWLATDAPARSLWLIENGAPRKIDLAETTIVPTGLARHGDTLYLSDFGGRVWAFTLPGNDEPDDVKTLKR
jgi:sugar lactone lactonase YvrE